MKKVILIIMLLILTGCNTPTTEDLSPPVTTKSPPPPINYQTSLAVKELSLIENSSERVSGDITHIVIHFISNVIANRSNPYLIDDIYQILSDYGASSHYIIDRDGTIYRSVPENLSARHAGPGSLEDFPEYDGYLNQNSIGIEILGIGTQKEMEQFLTASEYKSLNKNLIGFTNQQYEAVNKLINDILNRHQAIKPDRKHIIGHDEYGPGKTDPGSLFDWQRLDFMR